MIGIREFRWATLSFMLAIGLLLQLAECTSGQSENINDPRTWSEATWKDKLTNCDDWRKATSLAIKLQQLKGDADFRIIHGHWANISADNKMSLLRGYFPAFHKLDRIDDQYFMIMDLGMQDKNPDVVARAQTYLNPLALVPVATDRRSYDRWKKTWKQRAANEILRERVKSICHEMKTFGRFEARDAISYLTAASGTFLHFHEFRSLCVEFELPQTIRGWSEKGWLDFDKKSRDRILDLLEAKKVKLPNDYLKWTDKQWASALTSPNDKQWREGWKLGIRIQQLKGDRDWRLLKANWNKISPQVRPQILKTYQPWFGSKSSGLDDQYFQVMHLGRMDSNEKVQSFSRNYLNAMLLSRLAEDLEAYNKWYKANEKKVAQEIWKDNTNALLSKMKTANRVQAIQICKDLAQARMVLQEYRPLAKILLDGGIQKQLETWAEKKWIDSFDGDFLAIAASLWDLPADRIDTLNESFHVKNEKRMRYFLIGRHEGQKVPKEGFKICLILPGGNGGADFNNFCRSIHRNQIPKGYLSVQLVAPVWTDDVKVVWPTENLNPAKAEFTTETFVRKVIEDISDKVKINRESIVALGWSSSGPALYKMSLDPKSPIRATLPAMSVFGNLDLPDLSNAKGHPYYILHSPDDWIRIQDHAEIAVKKLKAAGAQVRFDTYDGGHGWRGDSVSKIGAGIRWLDHVLTEKTKAKK